MSTQRAVLVLGPGRSGTSTLTRALGALGFYLGRRFRRPVRKNPRGSYEEVNLLKLSKSLRNTLGLTAESVRLPDEQDWQSPRIERYKRRFKAVIRREFAGHPQWAFKYSGTIRLLPFWLELLAEMDIEPVFVFAYRNPLSVTRSRARLDPLRGQLEQNCLEWLAYVAPYFHLVRHHLGAAIDYDRLIADPEGQLRRLADHLKVSVDAGVEQEIKHYADGFVRKDWRHTQFSDDDLIDHPGVHPLVARAAVLLSALARDDWDWSDDRFWRQWQEVHQEVQEWRPVFKLIDDQRAHLRRARWWDLGRPLRIAWQKTPLLRAR